MSQFKPNSQASTLQFLINFLIMFPGHVRISPCDGTALMVPGFAQHGRTPVVYEYRCVAT